MKKIYIMMLISTFVVNLSAQNFEWANKGGSWAYDYGYGIANDNSGNVYVAGKYEMNANFNGTILPCQGNHDIYLAKYSPSGTLNWIRTGGGVLGDYAHALACDGTSSVYIAGEIEGGNTPIVFPGSSITLTSRSDNDVFLAKYDLNGNLIWAKSEGGWAWLSEKALGVSYDGSGNVYICGYFTDTTSFGGVTYTGTGHEAFVAKYNSNGILQWMRKGGGPGRDEAKSIKCDAAGNAYVCGMHGNAAVFGSTTLNAGSLGYMNAFVAKYAPDGTLLWAKTAGDSYDDVAWSITMDNAGKVYIAGEFNGYALFDSLHLINSSMLCDGFVACYDASGNVQWVSQVAGTLADRVRGIGCDGTNLFITGQFGGTSTFDSISLTAADSSDIFIAALNNNGKFLWSKAVSGTADAFEPLGYESGNAICAEASGNVYATGAMLDGGVFGSTAHTAFARTDVFIAKIKASSSVPLPPPPPPTPPTPPTQSMELITEGSSWKYLDNGSNQGSSWITTSYNDAAWKTGNAELGYGDHDEATIVSYGPSSSNKYVTTYFRKTFTVIDKSKITGLKLSLIRDDGAVVYINGVEVYRSNLPSGAINYNTLASTLIDGAYESTYLIANFSAASIIDGPNVIAVEIHQNAVTSSDISFNLKLDVVPFTPPPVPLELIAASSSWKYLDNGSNQGTAWKTNLYSDATWKTGNAELGYGDGGESTIVNYGPSSTNKYITTYFRKTFNVADISGISGLKLSLIRDDGAVVYINGIEVYRTNLPSGTINYNTLATTYVDGIYESLYLITNISSSSLVNGTNVIAVEIHQNAGTSSDISFNLKLETILLSLRETAPVASDNTSTDALVLNAKAMDNNAALSWNTNNEATIKQFIIERSNDGNTFTTIGTLNGTDNTREEINYSFIDGSFHDAAKINSEIHYRVKQTNDDGDVIYSKIVQLKIQESTNYSFGIYPIPANNSLTISLDSRSNDHQISVFIYDLSGRKVSQSQLTNFTTQIDISSLNTGIYIAEIKSEDQVIFKDKVIVQK